MLYKMLGNFGHFEFLRVLFIIVLLLEAVKRGAIYASYIQLLLNLFWSWFVIILFTTCNIITIPKTCCWLIFSNHRHTRIYIHYLPRSEWLEPYKLPIFSSLPSWSHVLCQVWELLNILELLTTLLISFHVFPSHNVAIDFQKTEAIVLLLHMLQREIVSGLTERPIGLVSICWFSCVMDEGNTVIHSTWSMFPIYFGFPIL